MGLAIASYTNLCLQKRYVFWVATAIFAFVVIPHVLSYVSNIILRNGNTIFRQKLARELQEIRLEIISLAAKKRPPSHNIIMKFEEIIHRLDSRLTVNYNKSSFQAKSSKTKLFDVCPEVYKGWRIGYPFHAKGWEITKCKNVKPIESVITILINAVLYSNEDFNQLDYVLDGIAETYPSVNVYIATRSVHTQLKTYKNVKVFKQSFEKRPNLAKTWNMLIGTATTPYVLIARDVIHFSWLSQLERQIRVVSEIPKVVVAGGSSRNSSGHWKMGCYQTTMSNYVLEYKEGYYHSRNECMFCDYIQGPFLAKRSILKFDESVNNEVTFEDLFLSLTTKGSLIMGCPDAMYFTTDYSYIKTKTRKVWGTFAKKWILNRILLPGVKFSFSCKDIDFKCSNKLTRSFLLPVCCQEQYEGALAAIQSFMDSHNLHFELDTGSVLGTVKFNGLLPWDMDGDITILSSPDLALFTTSKTTRYFQKHGIEVVAKDLSTYIKFKLPELYIEGWVLGNVSCAIHIPTKGLLSRKTYALVRGTWISTVFSPGLFSRNRYGVGILKHSQSWIMTGAKNSFSDYNKAGTFLSCEQPDHHSCLHNFPADGNIPFIVT